METAAVKVNPYSIKNRIRRQVLFFKLIRHKLDSEGRNELAKEYLELAKDRHRNGKEVKADLEKRPSDWEEVRPAVISDEMKSSYKYLIKAQKAGTAAGLKKKMAEFSPQLAKDAFDIGYEFYNVASSGEILGFTTADDNKMHDDYNKAALNLYLVARNLCSKKSERASKSRLGIHMDNVQSFAGYFYQSAKETLGGKDEPVDLATLKLIVANASVELQW